MGNENHEEAVQKEFEQLEGTGTKDLGSVDLKRTPGGVQQGDEDVKRLNDIAGWHEISLGEFPSKGRFYRSDLKVEIRSATTKEIREWSTMDENNIRDIDEKLNSMLTSCSRITFSAQRGSYKDFLEEDRIFVILKIKELTFKEGENRLMMPVTSKTCKTGNCKSQTAEELKTSNLQFQSEDELIGKYYDEENRCYTVQTKSYGEIPLAPPNIGVMRAITDYIREREDEGQSWDKSIIMILPYMIREWRGLDSKSIFAAITELNGLDRGKFNIIYRLVETIKVGIKPEFEFKCNDCGAGVTVPLTFPGGIKALFVVSDISSELL